MQISYAVTWQEPDGGRHSGRLELGADALRLEGRNAHGHGSKVVRYGDLKEFRLARSSGDRLQGRPTLLLELSNDTELKLASVAQPGIVAELADRLSGLTGSGSGQSAKLSSSPSVLEANARLRSCSRMGRRSTRPNSAS